MSKVYIGGLDPRASEREIEVRSRFLGIIFTRVAPVDERCVSKRGNPPKGAPLVFLLCFDAFCFVSRCSPCGDFSFSFIRGLSLTLFLVALYRMSSAPLVLSARCGSLAARRVSRSWSTTIPATPRMQ